MALQVRPFPALTILLPSELSLSPPNSLISSPNSTPPPSPVLPRPYPSPTQTARRPPLFPRFRPPEKTLCCEETLSISLPPKKRRLVSEETHSSWRADSSTTSLGSNPRLLAGAASTESLTSSAESGSFSHHYNIAGSGQRPASHVGFLSSTPSTFSSRPGPPTTLHPTPPTSLSIRL